MNPTPKARFLKNTKLVQKHNAIIQDENLQESIDTALAEYQGQLAMQTKDGNFNDCAAAHIKIQGAIQFVNVLKNLGYEAQMPKIVDRDNLIVNQ